LFGFFSAALVFGFNLIFTASDFLPGILPFFCLFLFCLSPKTPTEEITHAAKTRPSRSNFGAILRIRVMGAGEVARGGKASMCTSNNIDISIKQGLQISLSMTARTRNRRQCIYLVECTIIFSHKIKRCNRHDPLPRQDVFLFGQIYFFILIFIF